MKRRKTEKPARILAGPGEADIRKVTGLESWEDQLVDWLFIRHKIRGPVRDMIRDRHEAETTSRDLTLESWNDHFPSYPVWYVGTVLRAIDKNCSGTRMLCRMRETALVEAFNEAENEVGDVGKPLALIVRWPQAVRHGEPSGGMVLHNAAPNFQVPGSRVIWTHTDPDYEMLTLQPLSLLAKEIDSRFEGSWRP